MSFYACVRVREFPAQAVLRLRADLRRTPFVVMAGEPALETVCSCNAMALRMGVQPGMTRVELETFPGMTILPRSLQDEDSAREVLLECASEFSPAVEERSDETEYRCVLDLAGTERLHGAPDRLGATLFKRLYAAKMLSVVAIASNFHASMCLARGMDGSPRVLFARAGQEGALLAPLPIHVLKLKMEQQETFAAWGIHTLGMLAELPETDLIARMGQDGGRLRQLARGELPHHFVAAESKRVYAEVMEFDAPVEQMESLLFVMSAMLERLVARVREQALALAVTTMTLMLEGGGEHVRVLRPALPGNDRRLWLKLIHMDLEMHPPGAQVLGLKLDVEPGHSSKVQMGLFSPQLPEAARLDVALARVRAIVGEGAVGAPLLTNSHRLDDFQVKPFLVTQGRCDAGTAPQETALAKRQVRPPENISVTLSDQRPLEFWFRQQRYAVERAYGPWLTGGEWWSATLWGFAQWDVVARASDGGLLCGCMVHDLMRERWQMVALYD